MSADLTKTLLKISLNSACSFKSTDHQPTNQPVINHLPTDQSTYQISNRI